MSNNDQSKLAGSAAGKTAPVSNSGTIINENGEEVPITDEMVEAAMAEIKLQSIGAHTGYHKAITDDMLENASSKDLTE